MEYGPLPTLRGSSPPSPQPHVSETSQATQEAFTTQLTPSLRFSTTDMTGWLRSLEVSSREASGTPHWSLMLLGGLVA